MQPPRVKPIKNHVVCRCYPPRTRLWIDENGKVLTARYPKPKPNE